MRIAWTAAALRDLAVVRAFIAVDNLSAADRQVRRLLEAIDSLLSFPNMGRPGRRVGTRELVIAGTPYLAPIGSAKTSSKFFACCTGASAGRIAPEGSPAVTILSNSSVPAAI